MDDPNQKTEQYEFKYKLLKVNFIYVFTMFTLILAFVMSDRWTESKDFTTYLTNVATFVSVVLGLVAIFYSFISNSSLSKSLGNISKVSEEVVDTKAEIGNFLAHAIELEKSGAGNTKSLREISESVEQHVNSLKLALQRVTEKTQLIHESVGELPARIDKQIEALLESDAGAIRQRTLSVQATDEDRAIHFINRSSLYGRILIYACVLANQAEKEFSFPEFIKILVLDPGYLYGYLIAFFATGFVTKENIVGKERTYKITAIDSTIKKKVKEKLVEHLEDKLKVANPTVYTSCTEAIKQLEETYK
jgi:hypothetical protein